ncbi:MAG: hypothetical protein V1668_00770 [Patescibacteria group bacterium]
MENAASSEFKEKKQISKIGKWSVGLNILFLIIIAVSLALVLVLKTLSFDDTWWDITVPIAFLIVLVAFITAIVAVTKNKDRSVWVYASIVIGVCAILFGLLHSLFIKD